MINNRQGGRRRGRGGGGRAPNVPSGNRQDNRQRGNAAQLLEKYKQLARDAQMQGDRVQSEYYLQFADHYFRVLGESRARFEDQRPRGRDEDYDEDEGDDELGAEGEEARDDEQERRPRRDYRERDARPPREMREAREPREPREFREPRESREEREPRAEGSDSRFESRRRRPRRELNGDASESGGGEARIALDTLPPAIAATPARAASDDEGEEAPRPRRRTRRPAADEGDVTPEAA